MFQINEHYNNSHSHRIVIIIEYLTVYLKKIGLKENVGLFSYKTDLALLFD